MLTVVNLSASFGLLLGTIPGICAWRLHFQKDDKYLDGFQRREIETRIQELAQKIGITKRVELIEKNGLLMSAQAQGINLLFGRVGIAIDPQLADNLQDGELEFFLAHELAHIKANDHIWFGLVPATIGAITTIGMSILLPSSALISAALMISPAALAGFVVSAVVFALFSQWREECADKLAFSICSPAAQKEVLELFDNIRKWQIEHRNSDEGSYFSRLWRKCTISKEGNYRLDIWHPSFTTRISYLKPKRGLSLV